MRAVDARDSPRERSTFPRDDPWLTLDGREEAAHGAVFAGAGGRWYRHEEYEGSARRRMAALLCVIAAGCTFDSTTDAPIPVVGRFVIHDPAPSDANCEQRARQMMWMVHLYDAEATRRFLGLPSTVNSNVMTAKRQRVRVHRIDPGQNPQPDPTMKWFVLAMDETQWITECQTSLLTQAGRDQPIFSVGTIRFVRGESGCWSEASEMATRRRSVLLSVARFAAVIPVVMLPGCRLRQEGGSSQIRAFVRYEVEVAEGFPAPNPRA